MVTVSVRELERLRHYEWTLGGEVFESVLVAVEQRELREALAEARSGLFPTPFRAGHARAELASSLEQKMACLVPPEVNRRVEQDRVVGLDDLDSAELPWEFCFPRHQVVRRPLETAQVGESSKLSLLACVAEPEVMSGYEKELRVCLEEVPSTRRCDSGVELLTECREGVAYLAAVTDGADGLCLPQRIQLSRWVPRQLSRARSVPSLVVLRLMNLQTDWYDPWTVVKELLSLGVRAVIVNRWEPDPLAVKASLPTLLHRFEQPEQTVGQAFSDFCQALPMDGCWSRHSFLLYGDGALTAGQLTAVQAGSNLSATTVPRFGKPDFHLQITAGPEAGRLVPVYSQALAQGRSLTVGSPGLKRCQIEIEDPALDNEAFRLEVQGERVVLHNLCPTPEAVKVGGLPVYGEVELRGRQTISSGSTVIAFEPAGEAQVDDPGVHLERGRFSLQVSCGDAQDQGRTYPLTEASTLVGREGAFPLHDQGVSRQHLVILERDGFHQVCTLGQARVILNGVPLEKDGELRHGDRLQLSAQTTLSYLDGRRS